MAAWYTFAIIALFCYGIQNFLYKVSAEKRCNTAWTSFSFMTTVAVLSAVLFFVFKESIGNLYFLLFISLLNSVTFVTTTIARIEALKNIAISVAYPIIRLSTVIVVIFSLVYFKDVLSFGQIIGIILAVAVVLILTKDKKERIMYKNFSLGIILSFVALLASAATTIVCKFAALTVNKLGYIAVSYVYNIFFSLGLRKKLQTKRENPRHTTALIIGLFIGLSNFAGFFLLLKAFAIGPLSIIASINSLYFVIAIALSVLVYKEKLTTRRTAGIVLAVLAVILLRI